LANTYVVMELNPALRFGLGIYAPFGLQTEYDPSWIGRFQAIKSRIQTINFNPSLSYQVNEGISLGIGVNHQRITGELSNAVNYSAAAYAADPVTMSVLGVIGGAGKEGVSTMTGTDSAWGYNFGALINVDPDTRIGMAYRSKIRYTLSGTVSFSAVPAALAAVPQLANGNVTLPISMPDSFSLSGFHQMPNGWDVMADATWMGWSVLQQLKINRTDGTNLQTVQENWKNTWRVSTGASYHYNDHWLARVGVAYDQTPVSSTYMTARIPDNNRTWATLGGQYRPSPSTRIDFSYVHIFVKDAAIANNQTVTGNGNLAGNYTSSVDTLSVQYAHSF
jgi:long-chain fatty acid transport protein